MDLFRVTIASVVTVCLVTLIFVGYADAMNAPASKPPLKRRALTVGGADAPMPVAVPAAAAVPVPAPVPAAMPAAAPAPAAAAPAVFPGYVYMNVLGPFREDMDLDVLKVGKASAHTLGDRMSREVAAAKELNLNPGWKQKSSAA